MDHRELPFGGVRRLARQLNVLLVVTMLVAAAFGLSDVLSDNRATAQTGSGNAEYFLQIDGIPGESLDAAHRDQIELLSFQWSGDGKPGVELPPTGGAG